MADDQDKTVFNPAGGADRTVMRPQPGGRPMPTPGGGAMPPPVTPQAAPQPAAQPQPVPQAAPQRWEQEVRYVRPQGGLNPLLNAASTLVTVFEKTRGTVSHPNIEGLHQQLVNEIRQFDSHASQIGLPQEMVIQARYALCSAIDDAILNTPWGAESNWAQRTLLNVFHKETHGGA